MGVATHFLFVARWRSSSLHVHSAGLRLGPSLLESFDGHLQKGMRDNRGNRGGKTSVHLPLIA